MEATFPETMLWEIMMRRNNLWEMQKYSDIVCYTTLICDYGLLCLDWRDICDGVQQCMFGYDEENCDTLEFNECEDDEYRCMNGICIPEEYFLDGTYDCLDLTDEKEQFNDTKCIFHPVSYECDDRICLRSYWSCGDGQCVQHERDIFPYVECKSFREYYHMCELFDDQSLWTLPNGKCYESSDQVNPSIPYYCNRGVGVYLYNGQIACFCPPQYYGDKCQFHNDRLIFQFYLNLSQSIYAQTTHSNTMLKLLVIFLNENQPLMTESFQIQLKDAINFPRKNLIHLLYSRSNVSLYHKRTRYFNRSDILNQHPYSVRIEVYELSSFEKARLVAVWLYPVHFDFLPSFRLVKVLHLIKPDTTTNPCHSNPCNPYQECHQILNQNATYICLCRPNYKGHNCSILDKMCEQDFCSFHQRVDVHLPNFLHYLFGEQITTKLIVVKLYSNMQSNIYLISIRIDGESINGTTEVSEKTHCPHVQTLFPTKADESYLCICAENHNRTECFGYDHSLDQCSSCLAGGLCLKEDHMRAKFLCLCPQCYYGSSCQFNIEGISFTLDLLISQVNLTIQIILATLLIVGIMHIHELIFYMKLTDQNERTLCVIDFPIRIRTYDRITVLFHYLIPFCIQILSITILLILAARNRSRIGNSRDTFIEYLKRQFRRQKELYIPPSVIVLSGLPQVIFSFSFACRELVTWQQHVLLIAYFLSFAPQLLGFIIYVLPSTNYMKEFQTTKLSKIRIFQWVLWKKKTRTSK
ncbi:unnamed protein product [Rotaria sp. Silwood1]|nr:unnamed protein product [Rotaria sp. Silwood1]CAF1651733.1 unnamed protein product [Rotaria sp. Silwood1]CAF3827677.1 unnamed protein product [Rotaria sp. Silwood1]CAF3889473.1 unnamed protein product [Rotaria sp. Silwood1]CAF4969815.1 unnamed protein product [Rotaria sp. Silwood1]